MGEDSGALRGALIRWLGLGKERQSEESELRRPKRWRKTLMLYGVELLGVLLVEMLLFGRGLFVVFVVIGFLAHHWLPAMFWWLTAAVFFLLALLGAWWPVAWGIDASAYPSVVHYVTLGALQLRIPGILMAARVLTALVLPAAWAYATFLVLIRGTLEEIAPEAANIAFAPLDILHIISLLREESKARRENNNRAIPINGAKPTNGARSTRPITAHLVESEDSDGPAWAIGGNGHGNGNGASYALRSPDPLEMDAQHYVETHPPDPALPEFPVDWFVGETQAEAWAEALTAARDTTGARKISANQMHPHYCSEPHSRDVCRWLEERGYASRAPGNRRFLTDDGVALLRDVAAGRWRAWIEERTPEAASV